MGLAFQGKGIDVENPYRSRADQGASGPYLDRIGGAEEGLRGGPVSYTHLFRASPDSVFRIEYAPN